MIALDIYIIDFVNGNWLTLTLALGLLKIVAVLTPGTTDNKIHSLLSGVFGRVYKPPVGGLQSMEKRGEEPNQS